MIFFCVYVARQVFAGAVMSAINHRVKALTPQRAWDKAADASSKWSGSLGGAAAPCHCHSFGGTVTARAGQCSGHLGAAAINTKKLQEPSDTITEIPSPDL